MCPCWESLWFCNGDRSSSVSLRLRGLIVSDANLQQPKQINDYFNSRIFCSDEGFGGIPVMYTFSFFLPHPASGTLHARVNVYSIAMCAVAFLAVLGSDGSDL